MNCSEVTGTEAGKGKEGPGKGEVEEVRWEERKPGQTLSRSCGSGLLPRRHLGRSVIFTPTRRRGVGQEIPTNYQARQ